MNDGTPLESVEVKIDDGPWQRAQLNPRNTKYSWKLFQYDWANPESGPHTIVSRVTDINGNVQPTNEQLPEKVSFLGRLWSVSKASGYMSNGLYR